MAQVQQQQRGAVISKESLVAEIRDVLQGVKMEEALLEAVAKQAAEQLELVDAEAQEVSGGVKCSAKQCELEVVLRTGLLDVYEYKHGTMGGAFTEGEAAFECAKLIKSCPTDVFLKSTSSFFINIRHDKKVTVLFLDETTAIPRLLGVLQAHLASSCTRIPAGVSHGHGKWHPLLKKA